MNQTAQNKLRALRQRLADLAPYPWEPVEAWIASAKPLIKAHYGDHFDDFLAVTMTPEWHEVVTWEHGGGRHGPRRNNYAEAEAIETRENRARSTAAKTKILAFVDGLLDLSSSAAGHTGIVAQAQIGGLSEDAARILDWLREQYVKASHPNHKVWDFSPLPQHRAVFAELRAHGYIEPFGTGNVAFRLTDIGQQMLLQPQRSAGEKIVNVHHYGDVHMGSQFTTNISGSTVGAFAQGDHAVATGCVTIGTGGPVTQEQHKAAIKEAQTALVHDQDALEQIDDRLFEALNQFLTLARKIQVEQQSLAEAQAKMKETLDDVWAQQAAKGLRPQALPEGLKVIEALAKSPITAEVAKHLLAGS